MATSMQHPFCDLPNEIHPILVRENWIGINYTRCNLWQEIQSALRFAT
jgi:hypothetical protein